MQRRSHLLHHGPLSNINSSPLVSSEISPKHKESRIIILDPPPPVRNVGWLITPVLSTVLVFAHLPIVSLRRLSGW
ncbi:hypothetical protein BDV25DRAFT_153762 [Aspergillus avenaceus]|uniref:Uncharacterized protein n=1 Tax=Aspergillus avenaceus TaxID=36643 RepID=A0A5N6TWN0_ASPAV|nr:hypothetical protein BDV25DRAFT_153762 [Aspergillus avenaceus]